MSAFSGGSQSQSACNPRSSNSLHMSTRTLQRQFESETCLSLRSFRRRAKLLKALELLSARAPVSRISDQLGFGEPSAFISMFRAPTA